MLDLTDQRYGHLVVLSETERRSGHRRWVCLCECGQKTVAYQSDLRSGKVKSCGAHRGRTHGMSRTKIYSVWRAMRRRCESPSDPNFPNYGGRGITVCDRWKQFEAFYADMGNPPSSRYSLDRINVNGNYQPSNCQWATREQQNRNQRIHQRPTVGVVKLKNNSFRAQIQASGTYHHLGLFDDLAQAVAARKGGEMMYWAKMPDFAPLTAF